MAHNDPKVLDRQVWADSVDPDHTNPSGSQCLPFGPHLLHTLLYGEILGQLQRFFSGVGLFHIFKIYCDVPHVMNGSPSCIMTMNTA